eukprot:4758203-Amphidinium_carterae.1
MTKPNLAYHRRVWLARPTQVQHADKREKERERQRGSKDSASSSGQTRVHEVAQAGGFHCVCFEFQTSCSMKYRQPGATVGVETCRAKYAPNMMDNVALSGGREGQRPDSHSISCICEEKS